MTVTGFKPDGSRAFQSQNLRGLIAYARKHGITLADMGDTADGGKFTATFGNGATCTSTFADPAVMLGFFLGMGSVAEVTADRTTFNKGSAFGRVRIGRLDPLGRDGEADYGPWHAKAYRDDQHVPMVRFTRR